MNKRFYLALAATALVASFASVGTSVAGDFRMCTGGSGGNYEATGLAVQRQVAGEGINVEVVNTKGSWENLEKLTSGECDGAVVQNDAMYVWGEENGAPNVIDMGPMFTEYVHMLCRRDANIEDISDLSTNGKVMAGKTGSGSNVSIRGMITADKKFGGDSYSKIALLNEGGDRASLAMLVSGKADCMVVTAAPETKFLTADAQKYGDSLVLVDIVDKDFNDVTVTDKNGNESSVWNKATLPYSAYKTIMPKGVFGRKDVDTFGVNAHFIVSADWVETNPDDFGNVGFYMGDVKNILRTDRGLSVIAE